MATGTLVQIPFPVSPVARVQNTTFCNNYFIVADPNISEKLRKMITIIGLMYELNNVRGIDYRTNLKQLAADAQAYTGGISRFDLVVAEAAIEWSNGNRADATIPNTLAALSALHPSFPSRSIDEMDRMIALLRIRLGQ